MFRRWLLFLFLWIALFGVLRADEPSNPTQDTSKPSKSYVLTRLDSICEGTLYDRGDSYSVEFEGGGATSVSKLDVLFVGPTLESVYRFKESQTRTEDVNEVLKLADWASRRRLTNEALKTLNARLTTATDENEQRALLKKIEALKYAEAIREKARAASAQKTSSETTNLTNRASANALDPELEEWAREVPVASLQLFSRKVQPVLQKRCGGVECHDESNDKSEFVVKPKAIGTAAREALLQNLRASLDYVDFDNLSASPLVNHPVVVGVDGERVYPFGADRSSAKDCRAFLDWVASLEKEKKLSELTKKTRISAPESTSNGVASPIATPQSPVRRESFADLFNETPNANVPNDPNANNAPVDDVLRFGVTREALEQEKAKASEDVNSTESRLKRGGVIPNKEYRDEYDPNIFNDRYGRNAVR